MFDLKAQYSRDVNQYPNDLSRELHQLTIYEKKNLNKQQKKDRRKRQEDTEEKDVEEDGENYEETGR